MALERGMAAVAVVDTPPFLALLALSLSLSLSLYAADG